jgi:hypothetical protein
MCASDVTVTLDQALTASGLDHITVTHAPESDPKPAVQNNEADHKTPPDAPKRK